MLNECKLTDFGLSVKTKLLQLGKPQRWLEKEITSRTGLYMDSGYMYKILTGKKKSPEIIHSIREILGMEVTTHVEAPENPCAAAERSE